MPDILPAADRHPARLQGETGLRRARQGLIDAAPVLIAILPVGLLFGALSAAQGLTVLDAVLMSATMYAGASQLVAIDLFGQAIPFWAIVLSVFAVNFRHILYSAALTPIIRGERWPTKVGVFALLVDPQFAMAERRHERGHPFSKAWYFAFGLALYSIWIATSWIGASFGQLIRDPDALALDMIFPIYFLGLVMGFRKRAHWAPVVLVSAVVSAAVFHAPALGIDWLGAPWHVSLGGLAGILVAALLAPPADPVVAEPEPVLAGGETR